MAEDRGRFREALRLLAGYGGAAAVIAASLYGIHLYLQPREAVDLLEVGAAAATVKSLDGELEVKRAKGLTWVRGEPGMLLGEGDKVRTGAASRGVIRFKEGTEIKIGAHSLIVVSESSVELGEGSMETTSAGADSKMKIRTAGGTEIELVKREIDLF